MNVDAVRNLLSEQLASEAPRSNLHGCDLEECLVEPQLEEFLATPKEAPKFELWVVLEERPDTRDGYKIALDPDTAVFCLAYGSQPGASYVGHYGTFWDAFDAM